MTTIHDKNREIAHFMGFKHVRIDSFEVPNLYGCNTKEETGWIEMFSDDLLFDSSWDWLMPVVEKIVEIFNQADEVLYHDIIKQDFDVLKYQLGVPISRVHESIYQFIQWYNQQTTKQVEP